MYLIIVRYKDNDSSQVLRWQHHAFISEGFRKRYFLQCNDNYVEDSSMIWTRDVSHQDFWNFMETDPYFIRDLADYCVIPLKKPSK